MLVLEHLLAFHEDGELLFVWLLVHALDQTSQLFSCLIDLLEILLEKLVGDDLHVADRVNVTLVMHDLFVREGSDHMVDAIDSLDVRQESIAKTLTFAGTSHESSDIENRNGGGNL